MNLSQRRNFNWQPSSPVRGVIDAETKKLGHGSRKRFLEAAVMAYRGKKHKHLLSVWQILQKEKYGEERA